jgi:hypothetical protein
MRITGCCVGNHSDVKMERPKIAHVEPQTVAISRICPGTESASHSELETSGTQQDLVPFKTPSGKLKCCHAGCMGEYEERNNGVGVCNYHSGKAGFRDTRKFWTCCDASSYDWDEFMKIPTCCVGKHEPKMIPRQ